MAYIIVMDFSCMTICVWVVFKSKVEKNLKMIAVLKSVEGQASCTDEHYLLLVVDKNTTKCCTKVSYHLRVLVFSILEDAFSAVVCYT